MEYFEEKALTSAANPPGYGIGLWMTQGSSNRQSSKQEFLEHINQVDPAIKFYSRRLHKGMVAIPFLDTLVTLQADDSLFISVYWKPTHTDQYLQWDSHHTAYQLSTVS